MLTFYVLLGLLVGGAVFLIVTLLRHGKSRTENAEGLLIEQASRLQARRDRVSFGTFATHNAPPTMSDHYRH
ncbi:hypothetical protein [Streptomyces sp. NPDC001415]